MKINLENRVAALELLFSTRPKHHVLDATGEDDDGAAMYANYVTRTPEDEQAELVVVLVDPTMRCN